MTQPAFHCRSIRLQRLREGREMPRAHDAEEIRAWAAGELHRCFIRRGIVLS